MKRIAFFDSGLGGLTVAKPFWRRFHGLEIVYYGDLAHLPYGNKSPNMIRRYLEQGLDFLWKFSPDLMIVACHSASTQLMESEWRGIPVLGVIETTVSRALQVSLNGKIGCIGTRATIGQKIYSKKIGQIRPGVQVVEQACPLFVPLIEEGWLHDPITNLIAYRYLQAIRESQCDTLILGCTHYPIIRHIIQKVVTIPSDRILDPGEVLADHFYLQLKPSVEEVDPQPEQWKIFVSEEPSPYWHFLVKEFLEVDCSLPVHWVNSEADQGEA